MERRTFLRLLALGAVATAIDPEELLWTPKRNVIYVPHPAQIAFFNQEEPLSLYGIPYHQSNAFAGTWMGIKRTTEPWDWKGLMDRLTINTKEPLYVIDSRTMVRDVSLDTSNRETGSTHANSQSRKSGKNNPRDYED